MATKATAYNRTDDPLSLIAARLKAGTTDPMQAATGMLPTQEPTSTMGLVSVPGTVNPSQPISMGDLYAQAPKGDAQTYPVAGPPPAPSTTPPISMGDQYNDTKPFDPDNPNSVTNLVGNKPSIGSPLGGGAPQQSVTDQWNQLGSSQTQNPLLGALAGRVIGPDGQLTQASVSANDPTIRAQVDAYSAQQERARRLYLQEQAEAEGPYGNLRSEQRMSAESMGQNVGAFQAELMGRELESQRAELQNYLSVYGAMLTEQERQQLQTKLALMDAQIQESQFSRRYALDVETQQAYFDAVRRGLFRPE